MTKHNNGYRLLLVDDDPDLLHLLSLRLTASGYQVMAAGSAEQALRVFEQCHPLRYLKAWSWSALQIVALAL